MDEVIGPLLAGVSRRLSAARAVGWGILAAVVTGFVVMPAAGLDWAGFLGLVAAGAWVVLAVRGAQVVRMSREAAARLGSGRLAEAETLARRAAGQFSLLRPGTVGALEVLAGVLAATGRYRQAAEVAAFLLHGPRPRGDRTHTRLLLAESLYAAEDPAGAAAAAAWLYRDKLDLAGALRLLMLQSRLQQAAGDWASLLDRVGQKLDLADLLATPEFVELHKILLQACREAGRSDWEAYVGLRLRAVEPARPPAPEGEADAR